MSPSRTSVGIVAPSSMLPRVEFELGLERIREQGFHAIVHPQCRKSFRFFAGKDDDRAQAFFDFAIDPRFQILWSARGGYGASRLLPILDRLTSERGIPERKLFVGYSDSTALMDYVKTRWNWSVLHAPMPGMRRFSIIHKEEWETLVHWLRAKSASAPWQGSRLRFVGAKPTQDIEAPLTGGNLTIWASLVGSPFAPRGRGKIVFFEDIDESLYRIDRMLQQLLQSGVLEGARAIVLGNFLNCRDSVPQVLAHLPKRLKSASSMRRLIEAPRPRDLAPLRKKLDEKKILPRLFGEIGEALGIPVAYSLPVGHGPGLSPLPIGATYRLEAEGRFKMMEWDWVEKDRTL